MDGFDGFQLVGNKRHAVKIAVFDAWRKRNPLHSKEQSYEEIGRSFHVSASTVKRYVEEISRYGYTPRSKPRQGRGLYAWDQEAVDYFKGFLLAATREVGSCTVRNAYRQALVRAREMGWKIGTEASAYVHSRDISPALVKYATGGNRALDNMFYIARDLTKLRPFQMVVGDQHRFDFWVTDADGVFYRPECYLWLDMRTRLVYGIAFDRNYNSRTVLRALRMGIMLYGKFENTYNDNGSSEKSALADHVVEQLLMYGMRFQDEAEAYNANGTYVIEGEYGETLDVAQSRIEWQKKHRRVFAAVKNAKTKPIERFFSTLEQILRDQCLPGYVKEMGMSAPEEEEASRRLDWQKRNGYILNLEEFVAQVMKAITTYHDREHGTLKHSPVAELDFAIKHEGFQVKKIDETDLKYIFLEKAMAKVRGDRVQLLGRLFVGPNLTNEMIRENRGNLVSLDKKMVELRFDPEDIEAGGGCWAIDPRDSRPIYLTPVELVPMFDEEAGQKAIANKRSNMQPVRAMYKEVTAPALPGRVLVDPGKYRELKEAEDVFEKASLVSETLALTDTGENLSDDGFLAAVSSRISSEPSTRPRTRAVFKTPRDRYESILTAWVRGNRISPDDLDFKSQYESSMTESEAQYWTTFIRYNQGGN
jgi:putative transposase